MEPNIPVAQPPVTEPVSEQKPKLENPFSKWLLVFGGLILLAILFSGVYFLGIYHGMNQKLASKTPTPNQIVAKKTPTPTPDSTTNWKTFTAQSGVSFKYPTDWTPSETITPKDSSGYGPIDNVKLTSPNGLVIVYSNYISGLGGGCDPTSCPYNHVLKVEPVNIPGYGTLNLVELVVKDGNDSSVIDAQVGLIDPKTYPDLQVGSKKQFGYYVMFNDKDPNKFLDQFHMYMYDTNLKNNKMGQLSDLNQYFKDPEVTTAEKIIKTLKFTDQIIQANTIPTPTPTPDLFVNWRNYSDLKYLFSFKYPSDWSTQMKDYPENNQRLISIIKNSSPSVVSLSFTVSNSWANTGNAQDQLKNYSVGGVPAYRLDPPTKAQKQLDRYQTNVYFENKGYVYTFVCTHNWDQNYIDTCNNILSNFKFTQ
jgi:hypothetical protein